MQDYTTLDPTKESFNSFELNYQLQSVVMDVNEQREIRPYSHSQDMLDELPNLDVVLMDIILGIDLELTVAQ